MSVPPTVAAGEEGIRNASHVPLPASGVLVPGGLLLHVHVFP